MPSRNTLNRCACSTPWKKNPAPNIFSIVLTSNRCTPKPTAGSPPPAH